MEVSSDQRSERKEKRSAEELGYLIQEANQKARFPVKVGLTPVEPEPRRQMLRLPPLLQARPG